MSSLLNNIEYLPPTALRSHGRCARRHSKAQVRQIADSIRRFGFIIPVVISDAGEIVAGHGRVEAAGLLGLETVPAIRLSHLSETELRAFRLADNKLGLNSEWDTEVLAIELQELIDVGFDVTLTGFSMAEIDITVQAERQADPKRRSVPEDVVPVRQANAVTRRGEVWILGRHRLLCGDARRAEDHARVVDGRKADLVFTDPPYNVPIDGHVCGLGRVRHRDFAMGVGEMSRAAFTAFLSTTLGAAAGVCCDGAIAFVCMDWRHLGELLAAGEEVFSEQKNLCVWNKTNGGMGTFYRSKHELVCVFKVGQGPHTNTFGLGENGRYRTNVWDYPGISSVGADRQASLAMHPTVKPVALVADAIRDCSRRGDLVLDPFAGSGTTLIAAQTVGRAASVIEYDPLYCDTIVRRWERLTGKAAVLEGGATFEMVAEERIGTAEPESDAGERRAA